MGGQRDDRKRKLDDLQADLDVHLAGIAHLFKDGAKLMLVVYTPGLPDASVLAGNGDPEVAIAEIRKLSDPTDPTVETREPRPRRQPLLPEF